MLLKLLCAAILFVTSMLACVLPIRTDLPGKLIYCARHFGTGVIVATALVHLLSPANESLTNEALPSGWQETPAAYIICLLALLLVTIGDVLSKRYLMARGMSHSHGTGLTIRKPVQELEHGWQYRHSFNSISDTDSDSGLEMDEDTNLDALKAANQQNAPSYTENSNLTDKPGFSLTANLASLMVLEVGIVLHSLFVGISLAIAKEGATSLAVALIFHQTFEGFGLGARLCTIPWPQPKKWVPILLSFVYAITTPIGIFVGLCIASSYDPESTTALFVTGISDSLSAGVLLYTGMIELLANEFLHASDLQSAPLADIFTAFGSVVVGAASMSILALWV